MASGKENGTFERVNKRMDKGVFVGTYLDFQKSKSFVKEII